MDHLFIILSRYRDSPFGATSKSLPIGSRFQGVASPTKYIYIFYT